MARLKIGMDVDGVISDFVFAFRREAKVVFHKNFPTTNTDWDFADWGLSAKDISKVWRHIKGIKDWFYLHVPARKGATSNLPYLDALHELTFITTRIQTEGLPIRRQTQMALDEIGANSPVVIVTKEKGPIARDLQLDAFIDDKPENLTDVHRDSPTTKLFIMDQPYNQNFNPEWATRVSSLDEFSSEIDKLAKT